MEKPADGARSALTVGSCVTIYTIAKSVSFPGHGGGHVGWLAVVVGREGRPGGAGCGGGGVSEVVPPTAYSQNGGTSKTSARATTAADRCAASASAMNEGSGSKVRDQ